MGRCIIAPNELASRYRAGESVKDLAISAETSHVTVRKWLASVGVKLEGDFRKRKYDHKAIAADYDSGMSLKDVARKNGVDASRAFSIIKKNCKVRPRVVRTGKDHHWWKGGVTKDIAGYPVSKEGRLHRLAMQRAVGRPLETWEAVHHVDGSPTNGSISNLVIMPWREHTRFHSFLRHRGWPISRQNLKLICRRESRFLYRFTASDREAATAAFPLQDGRSVIAKPQKVCIIRGCEGKRYGQGLCSKHWQRKRAKKQGHWKCANGRIAKVRQSWLK